MESEDLKKIREMMEFLVKEKLSEKLRKLNTDGKKVYELSGEKSQAEIVKLTGFSAGKISKIWQDLEKEGILVKEGAKYRKVI